MRKLGEYLLEHIVDCAVLILSLIVLFRTFL